MDIQFTVIFRKTSKKFLFASIPQFSKSVRKSSMSKSRYEEKVSVYVTEIIDVVDDETILADLSEIQANFEQIARSFEFSNEQSTISRNFMNKWSRFVDIFNSKKFPNILAFRELFDLLTQIRKLVRPFKKQENYPTKLLSIYQKALEDFNGYLNTFKEAINSHTIVSDKQYLNLSKEFTQDLSSSLGRTLMRSSVPDKEDILVQIIELTSLLTNKISNSKPYLPHLSAIDSLTDVFTDFFQQFKVRLSPKPSPAQKTYLSPSKLSSTSSNSPYKQADFSLPPETLTQYNLSLDQLRHDLLQCSRRIADHATKARGDLSHKLLDESQMLTILANSDIYIDGDTQRQELDRQIQSYKEMAKMINRADAIPLDLDVEKLEKMNKDQLIALIEALLRHEKVPLELKVSKGSPDEYKELAAKYEESQRYCEQAEANIQKLNIQLMQLKTENKRLKLEADAANNRTALRERIKEIDQRRGEIADELRRSMVTGQTLTRNGTHPTADLYRDEIASLKREREEAVEALAIQEDDGYRLKIELLEKENRSLQEALNEKVQRIQTLQADLSRENNKFASDPPYRRRFK